MCPLWSRSRSCTNGNFTKITRQWCVVLVRGGPAARAASALRIADTAETAAESGECGYLLQNWKRSVVCRVRRSSTAALCGIWYRVVCRKPVYLAVSPSDRRSAAPTEDPAGVVPPSARRGSVSPTATPCTQLGMPWTWRVSRERALSSNLSALSPQ